MTVGEFDTPGIDAKIHVMPGTGDFNVDFDNQYQTNLTCDAPWAMAAGDFDNDGDDDFIFGTDGNYFHTFRNNCSSPGGQFCFSHDSFNGYIDTKKRSLMATDFDNDGNLDIACGSDTDTLIVFEGAGDMSFTGHYYSLSSDMSIHGMDLFDFNGDDKTDILLAVHYTGEGEEYDDTFTCYQNNIHGSWSNAFIVSDEWILEDSIVYDVIVEDLTDSGVPEVVLLNPMNPNHVNIYGITATVGVTITETGGITWMHCGNWWGPDPHPTEGRPLITNAKVNESGTREIRPPYVHSDSYDVVLTKQPDADVTVTATINNYFAKFLDMWSRSSKFVVAEKDSVTLRFTTENWDIPQTVWGWQCKGWMDVHISLRDMPNRA